MTILLKGDARDVLTTIPDDAVNQVATSVPYWRQRDYGHAGQIGLENTVQEYLERLWDVFDEAWRVITPDGGAWVNIGDKYVDTHAQLIPERFAIGMADRGWIPRSKIIWHKPSCKPESVKSRFTNDWEPVYFFAKSKDHFFAQQFEKYSLDTLTRCERFVRNGEAFDPSRHKYDDRGLMQAPFRLLERIAKSLVDRNVGQGRARFYLQGRNMRTVWSISKAQYMGAHLAVWPPKLVSRIVRAGCPVGGVVLDPFVGSGTTLAVAEEEGCVGIGIDLNGDYLDMAAQRVLTARARRTAAKTQSHIHIDDTHDEFIER